MRAIARHKLALPAARLVMSLAMMLSACAGMFAQRGVQLMVEAQGGGSRIEVGQKFYLTYVLTNVTDEPKAPASVPGAKVNYFTLTGHSSSFTSVNGKTSSSTKLTYTATLTATREGSYSFGPVTIGGARSNSVKYQIVPKGQGGGGQPAMQRRGGMPALPEGDDEKPTFIGKGNDDVFLRASVSKTTAWEQEALVYTVKLYTTYSPIKFIGATDAPKFDGFVVEESDQVSHQLTFETYNGRQYSTAVIARYIIFPQMEGRLTVKGNTYTISTDAKEYYHDPIYQTMTVHRPIQLNITPNDLVVNVKALPTPQPANFSGGVGQFKIASQFADRNLRTNEAASIVYTVSGSGNIKYVHLPDLNALYPSQLEVYSPETDIKATAGTSTVSGMARFDYSFMPMEEGTFEIPAVELVYFNPATGRYETSTARGYTVNVGKGKGGGASQSRDRLKFDPGQMSIGRLQRVHVPMVRGFAYWLWYIIPTVLLLTAVVYWRRQLSERADLVGLRSKKAGKVAARRLRKARACVGSNDVHAFYEEMLAALWGYLGDKLKIPTSELSRENVSEVLSRKGIAQGEIDSLVSVLDDCEMARYAPASTGKTLQQTYDEGADVINSLEDAFKKQRGHKPETETSNNA